MKKRTLPQLTHIILNILQDLKMKNIEVCNTASLSVIFERVIIATCSNTRQARAAIRHMYEANLPIQSIEGQKAEEWVLVDCGAIVVHMMLPSARQYYHLEELWASPTTFPPQIS